MKKCKCREPGHDLWCPRLVDGVDTSARLPADETEESAIREAIRLTMERGVERHGAEMIREAFLKICLRQEDRLRARFTPEHAVIQLLDDYHRRQRGF